MSVLANLAIPRIRIGDGFDFVVNWTTDHLGSFFDAFSTAVDAINAAIVGFFTTPSIIVFGIVCGLIGLGLWNWSWKAGAVALVGGLAVAQVAALTGIPPEYLFILGFALLAWAVRSWKFGALSLVGFLLVAAVGQWENAMLTLSLVLVAGFLAVLLSVPIGVLGGINGPVRRAISPVLDFMQTMPQFVYLIPAVMLFGIGPTPGLVATVVFAMPPGVRLTALGIQQVDSEVVEAGESFGSSPWRTLTRIQLPLALPTIMAGVNQVIMLSLSMVVIAGMVGAKGLGSEVYEGLTRGQPALGFEAGLAVVILAMFLDRITNALASRAKVVRAQELAAE